MSILRKPKKRYKLPKILFKRSRRKKRKEKKRSDRVWLPHPVM